MSEVEVVKAVAFPVSDEEIEEMIDAGDPDDESLWENTEEDDGEMWTSRWSFILAAVGSAIGLGNFWRFPFQVYAFGGGTFFIPYFFALFAVGIPMMQLEMSVGQVFRRAAMQGFGRLHPKMAGVGLGAAWLAFSVVTYYVAILAWGNVMLIKSFYATMPWDIRGANGTDTYEIPSAHFGAEILQGAVSNVMPSYVDVGLLFGALFMWLCVWAILIKGQAFISKAVIVTVLLPVFMLLLLLIVGSTLDGAGDGIKAYLAEWDFSELSNGSMWTSAFGQVFFSLGVGFGTMPAYASFNPRNSNIVKDAFIVSMLDAIFSFFAGFAVFTVVGYFSFESGFSIDELRDEGVLAGPALAFITYPAGLSLLSGYWANVTTIMFFVTFFFLGIDSAFALIEAVVHNLHETALFVNWSRPNLTTFCVIISGLGGMFYITDVGIYWLDFSDAYINSLGVFSIGFLEAFAATWMFNKKYTQKLVGSNVTRTFDIGFWTGMLVFVTGVHVLPETEFASYETITLITYNETTGEALPYPEVLESWDSGLVIGTSLAVGLAIIIVSTLLAISMKPSEMSASDALYYMTLHGPNTLRDMLNRTITKDAPDNWKFNTLWGLTLKFLVCPTLFILFAIQASGLIKPELQYNVRGYKASGVTPDEDPVEAFYTFYNAFGLSIWLIAMLIALGAVIFPEKYSDVKAEKLKRQAAEKAKN